MAVYLCNCSSVGTINRFGMCTECLESHQYVPVCFTCMTQGRDEWSNFDTVMCKFCPHKHLTCNTCKEINIYESVPRDEPPCAKSTTIKKTRLPDRYSTSRWTCATKPDPYHVNKYWKRQHQKSIRQFRSIKYA